MVEAGLTPRHYDSDSPAIPCAGNVDPGVGPIGGASRTIACLVLTLLLASCHGSLLLEKTYLASLSTKGVTDHQVVLVAREYTVGKDGRATALTRRVVQAGTDLHSFPELLAVIDSPLEVLESFEARLLHENGSAATFGRDDLSWASMSNRRQISTGGVRYLPISDQVRPGDLVETVSRHLIGIPQLGIMFESDETGAGTIRASCAFDLPDGMPLQFRVVNDTLHPVSWAKEGRTRYEFTWQHLGKEVPHKPFTKHNPGPIVLAVLPGAGITDWKQFGEWYRGFIADRLVLTDEIRAQAAAITAGITEPRAKMDAIARYCQERIRYEQVYLERGEIMPHRVSETLKNGYGDCKDYSSLMWALGRACGLQPHLALCHRGRGFETQEDFPVSQFNHMVVCYGEGDSAVWYDGTDKMPFAGVVSYDVVHAPVLVLSDAGASMTRIAEDRFNRLTLEGEMRMQGSSLTGQWSVDLQRQYAPDLLFLGRYLHVKDFEEAAIRWIHHNLSGTMVVEGVTWKETDAGITLTVRGEVPNCLLELGTEFYVSPARLFDRLLPALDPATTPPEIFYLPHYGRVDVRVHLPEFTDSSAVPAARSALVLQYDLPIGPLAPGDREKFAVQYHHVRGEYERMKHFRKN